MEGIPTVLTDEKQAVLGPIPFTGMPTDRTSLARIMGIDFDGHTLLQEGLVGNHGVQFGKGPLGIDGIGPALLLARLLALMPFGAFSNVGQVLQAKERMRMRAHESLTHDMIGVLLQPSLPSTNHDEPSRGRTGAFSLKTLARPCVMIGLGNDGFAGIKRLLAPGGSGHSQVAETHIYPNDRCMRFGRRLCHFYFQGDEQVKLLPGLVVPEFGRPDVRAVLYQSNMFVIARIRENDSPGERQDTHPVISLKRVVMPKLIGQGRGHKLRCLIEALIALLGDPCLAGRCVLFRLGPERFVDRSDLPGDATGHLGRYLEASAYLVRRPVLPPDLVAHLA